MAASAPVVIILPPGYEAKTDESAQRAGGLLIALIGSSINKEGLKQIERFKQDLNDSSFPEAVTRVFSCIGAEQVAADCPPARLLFGGSSEAESQLRSMGSQRLLIVRVHALKTDFRIRIRAIVTDSNVSAEAISNQRVFTAVFDSRVPPELEAGAKKNPAALAAYWMEGSPSRLRREVDKGLEDLRQMLTLLDREVPADNSAPASWPKLPGTQALRDSKRIRCGGGGCNKHRVVRDTGDRLWLTTEFAQGDFVYGWSISSMDDNTARRYSNIILTVQTSNQ
jgi:hypothetical protein